MFRRASSWRARGDNKPITLVLYVWCWECVNPVKCDTGEVQGLHLRGWGGGGVEANVFTLVVYFLGRVVGRGQVECLCGDVLRVLWNEIPKRYSRDWAGGAPTPNYVPHPPLFLLEPPHHLTSNLGFHYVFVMSFTVLQIVVLFERVCTSVTCITRDLSNGDIS